MHWQYLIEITIWEWNVSNTFTSSYLERVKVIWSATITIHIKKVNELKKSEKIYIGSTQQSLKNRFKGPFDDVQKWFRSGTLTNSFARHFAKKYIQSLLQARLENYANLKYYPVLTLLVLLKESVHMDVDYVWRRNQH